MKPFPPFLYRNLFLLYWSLSGEYPAVISGANVEKLEVPGVPLKGDSDLCRGSRVTAVVNSLAELPLIKRPIISVRVEIWTCNGSRFALILSSTTSEANLTLFSSFPSFASNSTSPVTSSSWGDFSGCALELCVFLRLNVLNL